MVLVVTQVVVWSYLPLSMANSFLVFLALPGTSFSSTTPATGRNHLHSIVTYYGPKVSPEPTACRELVKISICLLRAPLVQIRQKQGHAKCHLGGKPIIPPGQEICRLRSRVFACACPPVFVLRMLFSIDHQKPRRDSRSSLSGLVFRNAPPPPPPPLRSVQQPRTTTTDLPTGSTTTAYR